MPTILFFIGIILCITSFIWQDVSKSVYAQKEKIVSCFNDVDWNKQTFVSGGVELKDSKGRSHFYGTDTVDNAIKKLNAYLDTLEEK